MGREAKAGWVKTRGDGERCAISGNADKGRIPPCVGKGVVPEIGLGVEPKVDGAKPYTWFNRGAGRVNERGEPPSGGLLYSLNMFGDPLCGLKGTNAGSIVLACSIPCDAPLKGDNDRREELFTPGSLRLTMAVLVPTDIWDVQIYQCRKFHKTHQCDDREKPNVSRDIVVVTTKDNELSNETLQLKNSIVQPS